MALQISASHQSDSIRCIRKSSNIEKSCCCQFCVNKFAFCGAHVGALHGGMYVLCLRVLVQLSLRPSQRSLCALSVLSVAHSLINVNQVNDSAASQYVRTLSMPIDLHSLQLTAVPPLPRDSCHCVSYLSIPGSLIDWLTECHWIGSDHADIPRSAQVHLRDDIKMGKRERDIRVLLLL